MTNKRCGEEKKLAKQQEAAIYCTKHGHANYVSKFWGYVYCGRCGLQIGDQLGGIFDTRERIVVGHKCKICSKNKKKLSPLDKKILQNLEKELEKEDVTTPDYEKVLKDIVFEEQSKGEK